jgi:hypothetical protein
MALIFGASFPNFLGHVLVKHSCTVILENKRPSVMVNCRAISSASISINLSFRKDRGTIEAGNDPGAMLPMGREEPDSYVVMTSS